MKERTTWMKRMKAPQRLQTHLCSGFGVFGATSYTHLFTSFPPISNELREAYLAFFGTFPNLTNRRRSILPIYPAFPLYYRVLSKIASLRFVTFFISAYIPELDVSGSLKLTPPPRIK